MHPNLSSKVNKIFDIMKKKPTLREKIYAKSVTLIEQMVADGETVTDARQEASRRYGVSVPTLCRLTSHVHTIRD